MPKQDRIPKLVEELRHYFEGVPLVIEAADTIEDLMDVAEHYTECYHEEHELKMATVPPTLWTDEPITGSEFMTHNQGNKGFEIHFRTDSVEKYKAVQEECRRQIDHAKPEPPKEVE